MNSWRIKKGATLVLLGTFTADGVVTSVDGVTITCKVGLKNKPDALFTLAPSVLESGGSNLGKYKLSADTRNWPAGEYEGDIKYLMSDSTVHYDDSFTVVVENPKV